MILNGNGPVIANARSIAGICGLQEFLERPVVLRRPFSSAAGCQAVLAWGRKPSAGRAARYASRLNLPLIHIEDGFLRSIEPGNQHPPFSIVLDDLGIYYDATTPSRLESLVSSDLAETQRSRAHTLIESWRSAGISKYNHAREYTGMLPDRYVLAVDQTRGDASIRYGLADESSFRRMLEAALSENPECTVILKIHPDVMAGRKRGHFDLSGLEHIPRVKILATDTHPASLIEHAQAIYTVTSQMGFEGLLWGRHVRTFGMPFYAGWGLTQDALPAPERRKPVALDNLVHAALVDYPRYVDPESGKRCEVERLIEWMGLQRRLRERFPPVIYAAGFSIYKKPIVRNFFQGSAVVFVRNPDKVSESATLAVWGQKHGSLPPRIFNIVRLEDGFMRSVGLGADLVRPLSWVMDRRGMYYDATRPSDLESLLQTARFDSAILERASALRQQIVTAGLTKYNVGGRRWQRPAAETQSHMPRKLILVPGQVETDASLEYGAPGIRRNLDLLREVRSANPDAYVIYKPHPDVVAGLRRQGKNEDETPFWCDEIVTDVAIEDLLTQVDEIHTLTSLAGFEALLRNRLVVCYGQPFYAGWGLTRDVLPVARRTRRLSLDELVAGALILYPTYVSRTTGRFTTPEHALAEILSWRDRTNRETSIWTRAWQIAKRRILRRP